MEYDPTTVTQGYRSAIVTMATMCSLSLKYQYLPQAQKCRFHWVYGWIISKWMIR